MASTGNLVIIGVPTDFCSVSTHIESNSSALPSTNLQTFDPKELWRSTHAGTTASPVQITVRIPANSTYDINSLALVNHNLTSVGSFWVERDNSTAFSGGAYEASSTYQAWNAVDPVQGSSFLGGAEGAYANMTWLSTFAAGSKSFLRLNLTDTGGSITSLEAGKLILGEQFELSLVNFEFGWSFLLEDLSRVEITPNGSVYADEKPRRRRLDLNFGLLTESEAFDSIVHKLHRNMGITKGFFVVPLPLTTNQWHNQSFYCRLQLSGAVTNLSMPSAKFKTGMSLIEIL